MFLNRLRSVSILACFLRTDPVKPEDRTQRFVPCTEIRAMPPFYQERTVFCFMMISDGGYYHEIKIIHHYGIVTVTDRYSGWL